MDNDNQPQSLLPAFLRDIRIIQSVAQAVFLVVVIVALNQLWTETYAKLESQGNAPEFEFLELQANFDLADSGDYEPTDTYFDAYKVGVFNTVRVVSLGLVSTTILGVFFGIFLLSSNWLVRTLARSYVELLRNTPILLQIIAWYFIVILSLPSLDSSIQFPSEGIYQVPLIDYVIYAAALVFLWRFLRRVSNDVRWKPYVMPGALLVIAFLLVSGFRIAGATAIEFHPAFILSVKGAVFPAVVPTGRFVEWMAFVSIGFVVAGLMWVYFGNITETTGKPINRALYAVVSIIGFAVLGWLFVGVEPAPAQWTLEDGTVVIVEEALASGDLSLEDEMQLSQQPILYVPPTLSSNGKRVETGTEISPSYLAVFLGLVVYTSAFIAEIVRAGIQSVPNGQIEAAKAVGLSNSQLLRMILLPQALRVIIPPMGNQYLNLAKNSSLAVAVAYTDTYQVMNTVINQSGQSVTGIVMIMLTYLTISLLISLAINIANRRFQLVTR